MINLHGKVLKDADLAAAFARPKWAVSECAQMAENPGFQGVGAMLIRLAAMTRDCEKDVTSMNAMFSGKDEGFPSEERDAEFGAMHYHQYVAEI